MKKSITIIGSTGSVGVQIVDVLQNYLDYYQVETITACSNFKLLAQQAKNLNVKNAIIVDSNYYKQLKELLNKEKINVLCGESAILNHLVDQDLVFVSATGVEMLRPLYEAIKNNISVALANKESVVCGGVLLAPYIKNISPLDSEHFSIQQLLKGKNIDEIEKITLMASGGPFFQKKMENITIDDALNHPIWSMGRKISIDSATMMNKVLEVIEAQYLFNFPKEKIDILIHPEAIIHGVIKLSNNTEQALCYSPDMRVGINNLLAEKINITPAKITKDFSLVDKKMTFFTPDKKKDFPTLEFLNTDQYITVNSANEVAVAAFLDGKIKFHNIVNIISSTLEKYTYNACNIKDVDDVLEIHNDIKRLAVNIVRNTN